MSDSAVYFVRDHRVPGGTAAHTSQSLARDLVSRGEKYGIVALIRTILIGRRKGER